jgi:hypothetical protein
VRGALGIAGRCNHCMRGVCEGSAAGRRLSKPSIADGASAMVNRDQVMELRNRLRDRGWTHRGNPRPWPLQRRRERFTPRPEAGLVRLVGESVTEREFAGIDQGEQGSRSWANRWLAKQWLNSKRTVYAARWLLAARVTIGRWFRKWPACVGEFTRKMLWNFDELMAAANRGGKVVITGEHAVLPPTSRETPYVTLGAGISHRGHAPPPLLALAGPHCALAEPANPHGIGLWWIVYKWVSGVSTVVPMVRCMGGR